MGRRGKRPGRAWLLGAAGLILIWSLVSGLGGGGEIMPVREQTYDTAFNPRKELAMERRQEAEIRRNIAAVIAMADARDLSVCDTMMTARMRNRMDRMMMDRSMDRMDKFWNRREQRELGTCEQEFATHPPIEDLEIQEVDVLGTDARVEFTAMIRGRDTRSFRAMLMLDRSGGWHIDRITPRRR